MRKAALSRFFAALKRVASNCTYASEDLQNASTAFAGALATLNAVAALSYSAAASSQSTFQRPKRLVFRHFAAATMCFSPSASLRCSIVTNSTFGGMAKGGTSF